MSYPCHLVLSTSRVLATVLTILLQCFLSAVTSLSSASFIPVRYFMYLIHPFSPCRPLLLLPSPYASIILFSSPSDRKTCPKNPSFLLSAVCCSISSSSIPISMCTFISLLLHPRYSLHLPPYPHLTCVDLFSIFFVIVHVSQPL